LVKQTIQSEQATQVFQVTSSSKFGQELKYQRSNILDLHDERERTLLFLFGKQKLS